MLHRNPIRREKVVKRIDLVLSSGRDHHVDVKKMRFYQKNGS